MVERQNSHQQGPATPWVWIVAMGLSLVTAIACFEASTLIVEADAPLSRPVATLPPAPPQQALAAPHKAAKHSIAFDALHGLATWYGRVLEGHHTASGERFNMESMTAAHKTLPFGTVLRVVNLKTHKSVVVRVNDRGELPTDHVIDLSYAAAEKLDIVRSGVAPVKLEIIALGQSPVHEH